MRKHFFEKPLRKIKKIIWRLINIFDVWYFLEYMSISDEIGFLHIYFAVRFKSLPMKAGPFSLLQDD